VGAVDLGAHGECGTGLGAGGLVSARWIVEDYHQALKTGCRMEERQIESYEACGACWDCWLRPPCASCNCVPWPVSSLTDPPRR